MNPAAITKAKSRLLGARMAVDSLAKSNGYATFTALWYNFLSGAKGVYTVLEQGAKSSPQSRQWFGEKAIVRRSDPLLQYIFQARNDDEHGLSPVLVRQPGSVRLGVSKPGFSQHTITSAHVDRSRIAAEIKSLDGKPVLVEITPPIVKLAAVHGPGPVTYEPPTQHLGQALPDLSPITVALAALGYLEELISEAETL